jgi:phage tail-like protein
VSKYANVVYGNGNYGETPALDYSVDPMSTVVLDFSSVEVSWIDPSGNFSRIRLLRNQSGFPEHSEDGIIIWEEFATKGTVTRNDFIDGQENPTQPLTNGRPIFYGMYMYTDDDEWVLAGTVEDVIPSDHGMQKMIMDLIPKVYTSEEQSPLAVTKETSVLYNFIEGFSFTAEQFLTQLDIIRPDNFIAGTPSSLLTAQSDNVGLDLEPTIPIKNQKQLIRNAFSMYATKGTQLGIQRYVESLTGYAPDVTLSENLLLTVQDSTFYNSIGNWTATNATLTASTAQVPTTSSTNQMDTTYACQVVASGAGVMSLGDSDPVRKGIPVKPDTEYTFSCQLKRPTGSGNITLSVQFYNKDAIATGSLVSATAVAASSSWQQTSVTTTSGASAIYAVVRIAYSSSGTYFIDEVCCQLGDTAVYDEARTITVEVSPNKINYIKNPSFEVDAATWTVTNATFSRDSSVPTVGYPGSYSGKFVAAGAWGLTTNYELPITAGQYYTASAYIKALAATTVDLKIKFYDDADVLVTTALAEDVAVTTSFDRVSITGLPDSASLATYAIFEIVGTAATVYVDLVQFEKTFTPTEYLDGSMPNDFGVIWAGTANASYSYQYFSKSVKMPRLAQTLNDWMPPNTFWRLRTPVSIEYTNLTV